MGTGLRSQSLRGPRPSYGKLREPWGRPQEGRPRRALSLRQGREKSRPQGLDGGMEGLDCPSQEWLPGSLGDADQLIQAQQEGRWRWLRQYQQKKGSLVNGTSLSGVYHHLVAIGGITPPPPGGPGPLALTSPPVSQQVRRRWESFVASFPSVTLSQPASPEPPLDTTS